MKILIQILTLILFFSCGENQENKQMVKEKESIKKDTIMDPTEPEFRADSSYYKYWCSMKVLTKTAESIDELSVATVAKFLASFHRDCSNNIEYSEVANELLFEVASRKPDLLLGLLHKNNSLDKEMIKNEFKSPVHDGIDLDNIISILEKSNGPTDIKKEIIASLKIAKHGN